MDNPTAQLYVPTRHFSKQDYSDGTISIYDRWSRFARVSMTTVGVAGERSADQVRHYFVHTKTSSFYSRFRRVHQEVRVRYPTRNRVEIET